MTLYQSILLGIIQGLTEFLPISSSGHLVITPYLLGWQIPNEDVFVFDVLIQVATLSGVFAYFWTDILGIIGAVLVGLRDRKPFANTQARLGWYLVLATIPASLIGLAIKDLLEGVFNNPIGAACFLIVTAALLYIAERLGDRQRDINQITWKDAFWIGCAQVLALFPGVSRSGSTITGGMLRGLNRTSAARFSFMMSIPVMLAAGLLALIDLFQIPDFLTRLPIYIPGFIAAAITGYLSIRWLLGYLNNNRLSVFSIYCLALAAITFLTALIRVAGV